MCFLRKILLHFPSKEKISYFLEKKCYLSRYHKKDHIPARSFWKDYLFEAFEENIIFPCIFWERSSFIFRLKNKIIFLEKGNIIFPDNTTRRIIFQSDLFGKTIFSKHLKEISYFHVFSWERSSFLLRLKNKMIFSRKRIIFPDSTKKIIFQHNFFWKTIFSEHLEKENMLFCAVKICS